MSNRYNLIGYLAACFTSFSILPQIFRVLRMKEARDISLWFLLMILTGICLWAVYGILIRDLPVILANIVSVILTVIMLILKIRYR